jgi:hypothetical protein
VDSERAPWARRRSFSEQRKRDAALRYDLEMESHKVGLGDPLWSTTTRKRIPLQRRSLRLLARSRRLGALEEEGTNEGSVSVRRAPIASRRPALLSAPRREAPGLLQADREGRP